MKKLWVFFLLLLLSACHRTPGMMEFEILFFAELGEEEGQIGSNVPELEEILADNETFLIGDELDVPVDFSVFQDKVYIADKYNERITVFPLSSDEEPLTIANEGSGYAFGTNFQMVLNKYGEMFTVGSMTNLSVSNELYVDEYKIYYIYKFGIDGDFVYRIGEDGVNSGPMDYPVWMSTDLFDNLYVYHSIFEDGLGYWNVSRFSPSGELTFEFDTHYINLTNVIGNEVYLGRITDVYNFKNDEQLLLYSTFAVNERDGVSVTTPDEFYNSLDIYSVLKNTITENVLIEDEAIEGLMGISEDDEIILFTYDIDLDAVRFRYIDINEEDENEREKFYYAPMLSNYYSDFGFFIDSDGEIYSIVVKEDQYYVLLHWMKTV